MKKSTYLLRYGIVLLIAPIMLSSCATMFAKKTAPVVLMNSKGGRLSITDNGSGISVERVMAHGTANNNSTIQYFANGVMLDKKVKRHTLTIESGGKTGKVEVKLGAGINWIVLDAFTGGILGWGIDAASKKWRVAKNKYIDVYAVVNNTKPMSQGKLKRMMKREAKGK